MSVTTKHSLVYTCDHCQQVAEVEMTAHPALGDAVLQAQPPEGWLDASATQDASTLYCSAACLLAGYRTLADTSRVLPTMHGLAYGASSPEGHVMLSCDGGNVLVAQMADTTVLSAALVPLSELLEATDLLAEQRPQTATVPTEAHEAGDYPVVTEETATEAPTDVTP